jgi:hypothetical protein
MKKAMFLAVMLLFVFGCGPNTTVAVTPHPNMGAIIMGADRLHGAQNNDGGWDWENPDMNAANVSPANTLGVTALGLLDAYKLSGNSSYLAVCIKTADNLHALIVAGGPTFRLRGADITFLVGLSAATGDAKYANDAKAGYALTLTNFGPNATAFATYLFNPGYSRPYADWDINLYVQGLVALDTYSPGHGYGADAQTMTEVVYNNITTVYNLSNTSQANYWLVVSAAIDSFASTGLHADEMNVLIPILESGQQLDGAFLDAGYGKDAQATAYAVMALLRAGENTAAQKGITYLVSTQLVSGGWTEDAGSVENTEITSEVIQSLVR